MERAAQQLEDLGIADEDDFGNDLSWDQRILLYAEGMPSSLLNSTLATYLHSVRTLFVLSRGDKLASIEQVTSMIGTTLSESFVLAPGTMIRTHFGFRHESYLVDEPNGSTNQRAIFAFPETNEELCQSMKFFLARDQQIVQVPNFGGIGAGKADWMDPEEIPFAPKDREALRDTFRRESAQLYPIYGGSFSVSGRAVAGRLRNSHG